MLPTSPLSNKVIVIYSTFFFNSLYKHMTSYNIEFFTDVSGTMWNIKDVCKILLTPEKKRR